MLNLISVRKVKSTINIKDRFGILEHELEISWRIYEFALQAYIHADYLFFKVPKEKQELISKSSSLRFLRVVCARTCILEISKMLSQGPNNHYSLWILENRIRNEKFVGSINISKSTLNEILFMLNQNKKEFERIKTVRDKIVAHYDMDNTRVERNIHSILLPSLNLIHSILCKLTVEQYNRDCPPVPSEFKIMDIEQIVGNF
jgi:hypothetical protein